jgi:N5-(cytidine 5'-diphosphoramidyl)-L-glutamine hydrolase
MTVVAVTQRVVTVAEVNERRDCLDQQWSAFLTSAGITPLLLPNRRDAALALLGRVETAGFLLTGGNDLESLGGDAPERDELENTLLKMAIEKQIPLLGVCRGMQVIQNAFGIELGPVSGHVTASQQVLVDNIPRAVNSYHNWGATRSSAEIPAFAIAEDGVIKGIRHAELPIMGIMWHPERRNPFSDRDIEMFRKHFTPSHDRRYRGEREGTVYWVTGLSGAGKSTIGRELAATLRAQGRPVIFLDGDEIREVLGNDLGHTADDRRISAMRNAKMCRMLSRQGTDVVCCTISMFREIRDWNRAHIPNYYEVYLNVPIEVLKKRDPKGIYNAAEKGALSNVYGIDLDWDEPDSPDVAILNDGTTSPEAVLKQILCELEEARR